MNAVLDFLAMGGYALYVWGSLGMCAAVAVGEVLALRARRRALLAAPPADEAPVREPTLTRRGTAA